MTSYTNNGRVVTMGPFIVDSFKWLDKDGNDSGRTMPLEIGGGGTYANVGARIFLPPTSLGQIIDHNPRTFPKHMLDKLESYDSSPRSQSHVEAISEEGIIGKEHGMWCFRKLPDGMETSLAVNVYRGNTREFEYLVKSKQLFPIDLVNSPFFASRSTKSSSTASSTDVSIDYPQFVTFCASPKRVNIVLDQFSSIQKFGMSFSDSNSQVLSVTKGKGWNPGLIYEPYPNDCLPENLNLVKSQTEHVMVLSPNHDEALALYGLKAKDGKGEEKELVKQVEKVVREMVGWLYPSKDREAGKAPKEDETDSKENELWRIKGRAIIVRCGALGACIGQLPGSALLEQRYTGPEEVKITWVEAYWTEAVKGNCKEKIGDVTGGGNSFMGGLMAGLKLTGGDVVEATLYGTVSAAYTIEQEGLPTLTRVALSDGTMEERWNGDLPSDRLEEMRIRFKQSAGRPVI